MDKETLKIKEWLDKRFAIGIKEGKYFAHQPIYGYKQGFTDGRDIIRYARTLSNLKKISQFNFNNFIDIGGAEGYMANLVKKIFNVDAYTSDLSFEANLRAKELFGIFSMGIDLSNLPFKDEAFDIVLCSEVIEHVVDPIHAIYELKRITKSALLITTEAICYDKLERKLRMLLVNLNEPHTDRNWYLANDFISILGEDISYENTIADVNLINKENLSINEVRNILKECSKTTGFSRDGLGMSILFIKNQASAINTPSIDINSIIDIILNTTVDLEYSKKEVPYKFPSQLLDRLRCPRCIGIIQTINNEYLKCSSCKTEYKIEQGVPLLYTKEEDNQFLSEKWSGIYHKHFAMDYKKIMELIKLFKHDKVKSNFFIRILATRGLKIKKFLYNCSKVLNKGSIKDLLLYLLERIYQKSKKECKRLISKFH